MHGQHVAAAAGRQHHRCRLIDRERLLHRLEARGEPDLAGAGEGVLLRHHGTHDRHVLGPVVEDERDDRVGIQRIDALRRHVGLDLQVAVVDHGHHPAADAEPGADLGVDDGDDAGIGRHDRGPREIDLGQRKAGGRAEPRRLRRADGALRDDHLLPRVLEAALAEGCRVPEPFEPAQLLAAQRRLGLQPLDLRLRLVDERRQAVALGAEPDRVENGDRVARRHAVADRDMEPGDGACGARGNLPCLPGDQAPDHRYRLRHGLHAHRVDGDHRRLLGRSLRHACADAERGSAAASATARPRPRRARARR